MTGYYFSVQKDSPNWSWTISTKFFFQGHWVKLRDYLRKVCNFCLAKNDPAKIVTVFWNSHTYLYKKYIKKFWTLKFNELLPVKTFFDEIGDGSGTIGTSLTSLTFAWFFQLHNFFSHTGHRGPFMYPIGQVPLFCHLVSWRLNQYHSVWMPTVTFALKKPRRIALRWVPLDFRGPLNWWTEVLSEFSLC